MGGSHSQTKCESTSCRRDLKMFREKTKILQQKLDEMMCLRETESHVHDQEIMVHALKESEWRQERKWLQREVKRLKKNLVQQKTRKSEMETKEEAVEKWKRLYLEIKIELDNLINKTTHQGGRWREDELRREMRAKDETIQLLQDHIASIEQQWSRREREVDILRQSLRIITHNNKKNKKAKLLQH
ncbi:hypothetical protein L1987_55842 [Smallanthus sonchifolius]|uniref:Uncharacterized protein n=1 Tax=Smallanthus sonchifolius TaxID=185202 RepID=A0ACB9EB07_9ASTR|nr:hypothetical protein L1987_55842 [Smallanthus sonchifolius]